ncbi:MAG: hypothetical protein JO148_10940 [Acidimicrobiia bacterium]|nr:hypothetical protein [Acidimicrobiia bacterium]
MQAKQAIAAGCIAVGVFAGGVAVGHWVTDDSGSSASGKPQVLGQVFAKNPDTSTSTTAATLAPLAPPSTQAPTPATTTTAPPATSTQTATLTQTQTTSPPVTTVVVVPNTACGNGTATAKVSSQTFPKSETANTDYETDINVAVANGIDRAIQIDSLAIHLVYTDGGTQDVTFNSAIGNVIQPGVTNNYGVSLNTGKRQIANSGVSLQSFSFHTNGHPECTGHSA